jgi:hypothetical protein
LHSAVPTSLTARSPSGLPVLIAEGELIAMPL